MVGRKNGRQIFLIIFILGLFPELRAQGPNVSYYYDPETELSWASCYLYQQGGSRQKIPFLPVVCTKFRWAPFGMGNYEKDIHVDGPLVFAGNGIVKKNKWDSYVGRSWKSLHGEIDVSGKVVMFCYDFPDSIEEELKEEVPLRQRIAEAALRKASAVVLFSFKKDFPYFGLNYPTETEIPDMPVIAVSKNSAIHILLSGGLDAESLLKDWEQSKQPPQSTELISRLKLNIKGNFDKAETPKFLFRFQKGVISKEEMNNLAQVNEKALSFLLKCFKEEKSLKWKKLFTVYFRDFDSKIFYTLYWGSGFTREEGMFMIYRGGAPDYGLTVHENTHILADLNWGESSSFIAEGLGRYAEAAATDKDKNNSETVHYLKENKLFPLEEMVAFSIGLPGLKTEVGYPASGSFVEFLIEKFGWKSFKEAYILEGRSPREKEKENSWGKAYRKSLRDLEEEWLDWLADKYRIDKQFIKNHFEKYALKQKTIELDSKILEDYAGKYRLSPDIVLEVLKENNHLFAQFPALGKVELYPESETKFFLKVIDAQVSFLRDEKGEVTRLIVHQGGSNLPAPKLK